MNDKFICHAVEVVANVSSLCYSGNPLDSGGDQ